MHASNFHLSIIGNNYKQLNAALIVALDDHRIKAWQVRDEWFCCYWSKEIDGVHRLPFAETIESVQHTVKRWLEEELNTPKLDDYPRNYDGSVTKDGWELRAGWIAINAVATDNEPIEYEVFRIRSRWAEFHK